MWTDNSVLHTLSDISSQIKAKQFLEVPLINNKKKWKSKCMVLVVPNVKQPKR